MAAKKSLLVIFPGGANVDSQSQKGLVDRKTLSALNEFQKRLQGTVYFGCTGPSIFIKSQSGIAQVPSDNERVVILSQQVDASYISNIKPDIILISATNPAASELKNYNGKIVFIDDYSPKVRLDVQLVGVNGLLKRSRIIAGHTRRTILNRYKIRGASGMQCNGYASYNYYKNLHPKAHLFFDHRVTQQNLIDSEKTVKNTLDVLRLGFSGRLQELKGVHLFEPLLDELDKRNVKYTLDIMGVGVEEKKLEAQLSNRARFHGFMKFDDEWLPFVRDNIDLMVLPHIQGDSSSTYFESLGAGVPLIGFQNDSLTPLVAESAAALAVPMKDVSALAGAIDNISQNSNSLEDLRVNAFTYMSDKSYELMMDKRVEHLLSL